MGFALDHTFSPLESNIPKRKSLVAQGRVNYCDPLNVEWNESQNLTLTLHILRSSKCMHTCGEKSKAHP